MGQSNKEKVLAMFAALAAGDMETMKSYLHPDVIVEEAECLPYSGVYRGPDGYLELVGKVVGTWDDLDLSVIAVLAEGDVVVVVSELSAKSKAGVAFTMPMTEVFFFTDGKVSEVRPYYYDTHKLAALYAGRP
ncbi:MAG: nuclear transport factor 2 family protein [Desulfatitalea sp.]|nr:nuclear transport factor 2 family protein [Desulfatitalea sp.]MBI5895471.1 nuclear transport factor 2 family protein [Desulfobacterales bacterium]